jgi:hypothetical protein
MNPIHSVEREPISRAIDAAGAGSTGGRTESRFGRGTALKALGAALIGGVLGGGARSQDAAAKPKKKRSKKCVQKCPKPSPPPPAGPKVMWATVDRGGQLARGSGATSAKRTSEGGYQVYFEQEVETCAYTAQIPYFAAFGEAYTHPSAVEPNSVIVFTYDTGQNRIALNKDFHLIVTC